MRGGTYASDGRSVTESLILPWDLKHLAMLLLAGARGSPVDTYYE